MPRPHGLSSSGPSRAERRTRLAIHAVKNATPEYMASRAMALADDSQKTTSPTTANPSVAHISMRRLRTSIAMRSCGPMWATYRRSTHRSAGLVEGDELACKPDPVVGLHRPVIIHLGLPLPTASCGLPAGIERAARLRSSASLPSPHLLTLLRVGFAKPPQSPAVLVVSYTTVSPLPGLLLAVCSLWHFPAGCPGWVLPTTLPCGVRTFLDTCVPRSPGQLVHGQGYGYGRRRADPPATQ